MADCRMCMALEDVDPRLAGLGHCEIHGEVQVDCLNHCQDFIPRRKPLTMQDLIQQNKQLETKLCGLIALMEDYMEAVDRETCQIWEYVLSRK